MEQSNIGAATAPESAKRPAFLTVLCILTWIGSGLGSLLLILLLVGAGFLANSSLGTLLGPALAGGSAMIGLLTVCSVGSLFGAIMMWKLKKVGFYIYAGCQVLSAITPLIFGGTSGVMGYVFTALFIVLYGLNLKHMK